MQANGGSGFAYGNAHAYREIIYETTLIDYDPSENQVYHTYLYAADAALDVIAFRAHLNGNAASNSTLAGGEQFSSSRSNQQISMNDERWVIANVDDLTAYDTNIEPGNEILAEQAMEDLIAADPSLEGTLVLVPEYTQTI